MIPPFPARERSQEAARVMAGMSMPRLLRMFLFPAPLLCGLVLLSGCGDDRYPSDLVFPARADAIVLEPPKADAKGFDRPGELPKLINELKASGGKVLEMEAGKDKDWSKHRAQGEEQLNKVLGT